MKLVIQRVKESSVEVSGKIIGKIGKGLNILIGVGPDDDFSDIKKLRRIYLRSLVFIQLVSFVAAGTLTEVTSGLSG